VPAESESASEDSHATASADTRVTTESAGDESGTDPNAESEENSWLGYGLAVVLVGTLVLGLLRPFYPTASALGLGAFLALFGVFVGILALRERGQGS
jgi:hypothetical protein